MSRRGGGVERQSGDKTHLRVRVVSGLEPEVLNAHLLEEDTHEAYGTVQLQQPRQNLFEHGSNELTDQIRKREPTVRDDALHLMELGEMRRVHRLVPEHPVDAEQLRGTEAVVLDALLALDAPGCAAPIKLLVRCSLASTPRGELVQHVRRRGGRVRAQEKLVRLGGIPRRAVAR